MKNLLVSVILALVGTASFADCPASPPKLNWNIHSDDQRVDDAYLGKLLAGRKVSFSFGGVEHYRKNGKYRYSADGRSYNAPSYRFYANGVRCIAYPTPRFDLYVVNNRKLVLVNTAEGRYEVSVK